MYEIRGENNFFSQHFTAFLTKIHRVFYEFTQLTFLTWISASADFFVKPGIIRQLTADNLHQQQFFTVQQILLIFLKLFKSFKQNR